MLQYIIQLERISFFDKGSEEDHFPLPHVAKAMFGTFDGKPSNFALRKTLTPQFYLDTVPIDSGLCNNFS